MWHSAGAGERVSDKKRLTHEARTVAFHEEVTEHRNKVLLVSNPFGTTKCELNISIGCPQISTRDLSGQRLRYILRM